MFKLDSFSRLTSLPESCSTEPSLTLSLRFWDPPSGFIMRSMLPLLRHSAVLLLLLNLLMSGGPTEAKSLLLLPGGAKGVFGFSLVPAVSLIFRGETPS